MTTPKTKRLLLFIGALCRGETIRASEWAKRCGVHRSGVYRDIETLREFGFNVRENGDYEYAMNEKDILTALKKIGAK